MYVGAKQARISKAGAMSISFKIPRGGTGTVQVYVVVNGKESNRVDFTIN